MTLTADHAKLTKDAQEGFSQELYGMSKQSARSDVVRYYSMGENLGADFLEHLVQAKGSIQNNDLTLHKIEEFESDEYL